MTAPRLAPPALSSGPVESLAALSAVLDLANGLAPDKSLLTGFFALELARARGLPPADVRAAFYAGLLRQLGCTAYAPEQSRLGDDIELRKAMLLGDDRSRAHVVGSVLQANESWIGSTTALGRLLVSAPNMRTEWFSATCDAARLLAEGLGLEGAVPRALDEMHERWDGRGGPRGLGGEACSVVARVSQVANVAVLFFLHGGPELAADALALQRGKALDPELAKLARTLVADLDRLTGERIAAVEGILAADPPAIGAEGLALAFGDFADLQVPEFAGHSRRVSNACAKAAARLELDAGARAHLSLAAPLHDLGQVATPTGVWLRAKWSAADREAAHGHSFATERLLAGASMLRDVSALAGAHHERLDGSGYPRRARAIDLSRAERLLAAADVYTALQEPRPHRAPLSARASDEALRGEVRSGRLDPDCVAALSGIVGSEQAVARGPTSDLTSRELDVLRLLARGSTNKEIATRLGISPRTVQHHTIHIYEKLGVRSRAGASLIAVRAGLL